MRNFMGTFLIHNPLHTKGAAAPPFASPLADCPCIQQSSLEQDLKTAREGMSKMPPLRVSGVELLGVTVSFLSVT